MSGHTREAARSGIRVAWAAAAIFVVAALTLAPRSIVAPARGAFMHTLSTLFAPLLEHTSYTEVESILNALLFVPLGVAIALVLPRRWWMLAPILGAALSLGVEFLQLRIPGRVPDLDDVLWNSVGALAGAVIAVAIRSLRRSRPRAG